MLRWVGLGVVTIGIIHVISALFIYGSQLVDFAGSGFGGLYDAPDDQNAALWSVMFGVVAAAAGQQIYWSADRFGSVSIVPGIVLTVVGAVGAWYVPFAPFWIAAALGIAVIVLVLRQPDPRRTSSTPAD